MTTDRLRRAPAWQRALFTGVCAYEVVAMWTNLPTITRMVHKCPPLAGPILAGLAVHFQPDREVS